jgi:type IV secretory pathway VirJ component
LAAYKNITARLVPTIAPPAQIGDLPVTEVPAENSTAAREVSGTAASSDEMALLLTGDGGWAGLDQELATRLAAAGVPTVGLNSLKYFWTERTPDQTAQDVARVMRHYLTAWNKQRVLLVGYSFGADVLPFVMNRLPPDLRSKVATVSLLGVDAHASFEIKIADWVGTDDDGPSTQPEVEVAAKTGIPVLCIYGEGESDSICPGLSRSPQSTAITLAEIGKGHHFSGAHAELAGRILALAQRRIT